MDNVKKPLGPPLKSETKRDTRVNLTIPAILYEEVNIMAAIADTSLNDYITKVLENVVDKNQVAIAKYREAREAARAAVAYDLYTEPPEKKTPYEND